MSKLTTRPDTSPFGLRMTERMKARGVDDQDVAEATDLSYDTVRAIRRLANKNPNMKTVTKVAEFLSVSADWLLHGDNANSDSAATEGFGDANRSSKITADRVQRLKRELAEAYADLTGDAVEDVRIAVTTVYHASK
jgi:transcriptional regulator with XRE-family HTH domain